MRTPRTSANTVLFPFIRHFTSTASSWFLLTLFTPTTAKSRQLMTKTRLSASGWFSSGPSLQSPPRCKRPFLSSRQVWPWASRASQEGRFPRASTQFRHTAKTYQDFWTSCGVANSRTHAAPGRTDTSSALLQSLKVSHLQTADPANRRKTSLPLRTWGAVRKQWSHHHSSFYSHCCPSQEDQAQESKMSTKT